MKPTGRNADTRRRDGRIEHVEIDAEMDHVGSASEGVRRGEGFGAGGIPGSEHREAQVAEVGALRIREIPCADQEGVLLGDSAKSGDRCPVPVVAASGPSRQAI
nr:MULTISPECIES: hypothetical protein [Microbacterium]